MSFGSTTTFNDKKPFYEKIPPFSSRCKDEKPNLSFTDLEDLFVDGFYKYKCHNR